MMFKSDFIGLSKNSLTKGDTIATLQEVEESGPLSSGYIKFQIQESRLSNDSKAILGRLANYMTSQPSYRSLVKGHGTGDKFIAELVTDRIYAIIDYMVTKYQIDRNRFTFKIEEGGDMDIVDFGPESGKPSGE